MTLLWLILVPVISGLLALLVGRKHAEASRWIAMAAMAMDLLLTLTLWIGMKPQPRWWYELDQSWIPEFGIRLHLAMDGISLALPSAVEYQTPESSSGVWY